MSIATAPDTSVLFCKAAMAMKELSKADAQRLLKAARSSEVSAGSIAEKLGFLTPAARERVEAKVQRHLAKKAGSKSDSKLTSKSDSRITSKSDSKQAESSPDSKLTKSDAASRRPKRKGKRSQEERKVGSRGRVAARRSAPPPRNGSVLLMAGGALVFGLLAGVGAMFAASTSDDSGATVAKKENAVTAPAITKDDNTSSELEKSSQRAAELEFALSSAAKLRELEKERSALKILDEFLTKHGEVHKAVVARKALMKHCQEVLAANGAQARRLTQRGDHVQAAHMVANLRGRLPSSMLARINAIALELEQSAPATRAEVKIAKAEPAQAEPIQAEDEPTQADEDESFEPSEEPAEPVAAKAEPRPAVKKSADPADTDAGEEDGFEDEDEGEDPSLAGLAIDRDSPVAMALGEIVHAPHSLRKNGEFSVTYPMADPAVAEDFEVIGFDKFQVGSMDGVSAVSRVGMECGVGSQRMARFKHSVPLDGGEFQIEAELWLNYSNTRTQLVFLVGKKYGVSWGQQLVKVSKRGKLKALSGKPEPTMFREERLVKVKMTYKDGLFTVFCNGRKTAEKKIKANDLRGHFGLLAKDVRMQITNLTIKGTIDTSSL